MRRPTLLDGNDVMVRNLWRLLAWGTPMAEARLRVLQQGEWLRSRVRRRGGGSRPTFDAIDTQAATLH